MKTTNLEELCSLLNYREGQITSEDETLSAQLHIHNKLDLFKLPTYQTEYGPEAEDLPGLPVVYSWDDSQVIMSTPTGFRVASFEEVYRKRWNHADRTWE